MKINKIQTIVNVFNEDNTLRSTTTHEVYALEAEPSKILKNIKTGFVIAKTICVAKQSEILNYIEIDEPNVL